MCAFCFYTEEINDKNLKTYPKSYCFEGIVLMAVEFVFMKPFLLKNVTFIANI